MIGGLLHPLLAFGMLAAAVPLIIHLLNRRRHQPLDWAAMRFARAAWKRIRRRTRFENLLLLLLRMGAVALFALALARPFTSAGGPLGGLSKEHREVFVLLDGSASMGYRIDLESVWDRAVKSAKATLESLDGASGDRAHLYLVGDVPRLLSNRTPEEALSMLTSLEEPLAEGFDLEAALTRVLSDLDAQGLRENEAVQLLLITDRQRGNFLGPQGPRAREALLELEERGLLLLVEDATGSFTRRPDNLSITEFAALDPFGEALALGRGAAPVLKGSSAATFLARVENSGDQGRDVNVALVVDGQRRPSERLFVPAAGSAEVELDASLSTAGEDASVGGFRNLEAVIEADALGIDDRRALVVFDPGALRVLLINGAPSADFESDEVAYLRAALEPPSDALEGPFDVRVRTPGDLASSPDLGPFDFIWMANVEDPSPALVEALVERVSAGATLVVSLGDRVIASRYNERLGAAGLLPAELLERRGDPSRRGTFRRARIDAPEHPALDFFRDERYELFFTEVPVYEYFHSKPTETATVLASLDDAVTSGSPLFVEDALGRGRVVLWTTSIDPDWTLFPESPTSLIPLTHELAFGSVVPPGPSRNLFVGDPIAARFDSFPESPTLVAPSGSARRIDASAVEVPADAPDAGAWLLAARPSAERPGVWQVNTAAGNASFAVTLASAEGRLERLSSEELAGLSPVFQLALEKGDAGGVRAEDGELFLALLILALLFLIAEALWARHLARERV